MLNKVRILTLFLALFFTSIVPHDSQAREAGPVNAGKLLHAAAQGNTDQVKALLASGADGSLAEAITAGHFDLAEEMVRRGADINIPSRSLNNKTPFQSVLQIRLIRGEAKSLLATMLGAKPEVDAAYPGGSGSPLIYSISFGNPEIVEALLLAGADPNKQYGGSSAFYEALIISDVTVKKNILRLLVDHGGDVRHAGDLAGTPISELYLITEPKSVSCIVLPEHADCQDQKE